MFDSNDLPQPIQLEYRLASTLCLTFGRDIPLKLPRLLLEEEEWLTHRHTDNIKGKNEPNIQRTKETNLNIRRS